MKRSVNVVRVMHVLLAFGLGACGADADEAEQPVAGAAGLGGAGGATGGAGGAGGAGGTGGDTSVGGNAGVGGAGGAGGAAGVMSGGVGGTTGGAGGTESGGSGGEAGTGTTDLEHFSFFVTSLRAMRELSGSQDGFGGEAGSQDGFGGDLSYGETGVGAGLRGADKICTEIAEQSMPGSGAKEWHAFLSAVAAGEDGGPVHAKDRIGQGPWYDRLGRLVANNLTELINERPTTADPAIIDDFPNEDGVPNHNPDGTGEVDNHDFLTGSNDLGEVYAMDMKVTCNDWTKSEADSADAPRVGHSWPRRDFPGGGMFPGGSFPGGTGGPGGNINMVHWISSLDEAGCGPSVGIIEMGAPNEQDPTVGSGGGYGGIYCFAMQP